MQVVPVIDLKNGIVVRARMGERERYQPIETRLSPSCDVIEVARGLLSVHPFPTLYAADLDAIAGTGDNLGALKRLRAEFADVTLWVDSGIADLDRAEAWLAAGLGHLVLGSETQRDGMLIRRLAANDRVLLSLDFRDQAYLGPSDHLDQAGTWPQTVIVMTLARVGSGTGPDFPRLLDIRKVAGERSVFAAGGIRDVADLLTLKNIGIAGALVASSLHDGALRGDDIARL
jgi:phosphoribosylformimino-5-aminoimidazole carboxamide ribotide isomerase